MSKLTLTGIKPTGSPHIGNYLGGIRPAIECSQVEERAIFFVADYHALTVIKDPAEMRRLTLEVAATWLAFLGDRPQALVYRDSDIPEIFELNWIFSCVTAKGLLNRAHAYKASMDENIAAGRLPDAGVNMGLFNYPILMAADILAFSADNIPVGRDQQQHVEIARDIAISFNSTFKSEILTIPAAVIMEEVDVIGLDGRKMSKNYKNTIPLFAPPVATTKAVMKIITDGKGINEPKDAESNSIYKLYRAFASVEESVIMRTRLEGGLMGWGQAKELLSNAINKYFESYRMRYYELMAQPSVIEARLSRDAEIAREIARPILRRVKKAIGIV